MLFAYTRAWKYFYGSAAFRCRAEIAHNLPITAMMTYRKTSFVLLVALLFFGCDSQIAGDSFTTAQGTDSAVRLSGANHGGAGLYAEMTGEAERPGPGDVDGSGVARFTINPGQSLVCYELEVQDIAPAAAAHIHVGGPDEPGPVVVPLTPPTSGTSSGCVEVDRSLLLEILRNPEAYYVNVHNADFPPGAVRGQLHR